MEPDLTQTAFNDSVDHDIYTFNDSVYHDKIQTAFNESVEHDIIQTAS